MIRLIREEEVDVLLPLCEKSALGCRIGSALLCYQGASFFDVWVQEDASGIQTILCRLDGAMTIVDIGKTGHPEQMAFCNAVGFSSLTASSCSLKAMGLAPSTGGVSMAFPARTDKLPNISPDCAGQNAEASKALGSSSVICWDASPRLYYPILEQCQGDGIQLPPFDTWYVDCSHRMRRGWMRGGIVRENNVDAGCILAVETPHAALITGVAVLPRFRGNGMGKRLVSSMLSSLTAEHKTCFLLCRPGLTDFYRSLGFQPSGHWASALTASMEVPL